MYTEERIDVDGRPHSTHSLTHSPTHSLTLTRSLFFLSSPLGKPQDTIDSLDVSTYVLLVPLARCDDVNWPQF